MKSWALSTRSTSPSSPRKELSRPPSSLVTRSTLVATSSFPWRSSFPSPSPLPVLPSPRELVVVPEAVPCAVAVVVAVVAPCVVVAAALPEDAVAPAVVASVVVAVVVSAVVSRGVVAEEDLVVEASEDGRQSLSCLVVLSSYGVMGNGSFYRNLFVSIFLCILGKICWFSVRRGCRESQPSNSCIATIDYAKYCSFIICSRSSKKP